MDVVAKLKKLAVVHRKKLFYGLIAFFIFFYWRLPLDGLVPWVKDRLSKSFAREITLTGIETTLLPGALLKGVEFKDAKGKDHQLGDVTVRIKLLPLLLWQLKVDLHIENPHEKFKVQLSRGLLLRKKSRLAVTIDDYLLANLDKAGVLSDLFKDWKSGLINTNPMMSAMLATVALQGKIEGRLSFVGKTADLEKFQLANLDIAIDFKGEKVVLDKVLPQKLDLGQIDVAAFGNAEKWLVKMAQIKGKDIEVNASGDWYLDVKSKSRSKIPVTIVVPKDAPNTVDGALSMALGSLGVSLQNRKTEFTLTSGPRGVRVAQ